MMRRLGRTGRVVSIVALGVFTLGLAAASISDIATKRALSERLAKVTVLHERAMAGFGPAPRRHGDLAARPPSRFGPYGVAPR